MLRRSLRGFCIRIAAVMLAVAIPLSGWKLWTLTDRALISTMVSKAPVVETISSSEFGGSVAVTQWAVTLAMTNRLEEALSVIRQLKDKYQAESLVDIAIALTSSNKPDEAEKVWKEAMEAVSQLTDESDKSLFENSFWR
jgi:ribosomal protein S7